MASRSASTSAPSTKEWSTGTAIEPASRSVSEPCLLEAHCRETPPPTSWSLAKTRYNSTAVIFWKTFHRPKPKLIPTQIFFWLPPQPNLVPVMRGIFDLWTHIYFFDDFLVKRVKLFSFRKLPLLFDPRPYLIHGNIFFGFVANQKPPGEL